MSEDDGGRLRGHCGSCLHWEEWEGNIGHCKRYPPTLFPGYMIERMSVAAALDFAEWPATTDCDFCGEYEYIELDRNTEPLDS